MTPLRLTVPREFQGMTGISQGGYIGGRIAEAVGEPVTVAYRASVPVDTPLLLHTTDDGWALTSEAEPERTLLFVESWTPDCVDTEPVSVDIARDAATRFPLDASTHPAPSCFSCGLQPESMGVHSGELPDGRWATSWQVPEWAVREDRTIDPVVLWSAIDCATGWYVGWWERVRPVVTVQLAVDVVRWPEPGVEHSIVTWWGDYQRDFDGRKRGGAAAVFDADGECVARSRSFWLETS